MKDSQKKSASIINDALINDDQKLLFQSESLEEVREQVSAVYKPHHLDIKKNTELNSRMHSIHLGEVQLNRLKYGAEVEINPKELEQFYLIQMPVNGFAIIESGNQYINCNAEKASVLNPTDPLTMRWSDDCDMLMFRIERAAVERACSQYLGRGVGDPLVFKHELSWGTDPLWTNMMMYLVRLIDDLPFAPDRSIICNQLEQMVISTLLGSQPHSYSEAINTPHKKLAPRYVKRVEEYIEENAHEPLTPGVLADFAGVSVRTLYSGFKDFRQVSPMSYLKQIRLRLVKGELESSGSSLSVTEAALNWGFTHMGRFSQDYQKAFGEKPSQTIQRREVL